MKKLLLYSGGMDSTLVLYQQKPDECLFLAYGQAHLKEWWFAKKHCEITKTPITRLELPKLQGSTLTGGGGTCVVPARNLVFLSIAANYAEANGFDEILLGCNKDDHADFPDCRSDFWISIHHLLKQMEMGVILRVPLINFTKKKIMRELALIGVDKDETWSCYAGSDKPCGKCEACKLRGND